MLVSSVDGVGTKLKIAFAMNKHDTIGQDLVNHCINDIAVIGAKPLFSWITSRAKNSTRRSSARSSRASRKPARPAPAPSSAARPLRCRACITRTKYDVAGTIVGVVDRKKLLDGSKVKKGDVIIGLASSGLHTNGYSLARHVLFDQVGLKTTSKLPDLKRTLGEELLQVHRNYQPLMASLPDGMLNAAAHITGGGLVDNLPRVLPTGCSARIFRASWKVPPLFKLIESSGRVDPLEMYQVFNMGIGMTLIVSPARAQEALKLTRGKIIGEIVKGDRRVLLE